MQSSISPLHLSLSPSGFFVPSTNFPLFSSFPIALSHPCSPAVAPPPLFIFFSTLPRSPSPPTRSLPSFFPSSPRSDTSPPSVPPSALLAQLVQKQPLFSTASCILLKEVKLKSERWGGRTCEAWTQRKIQSGKWDEKNNVGGKIHGKTGRRLKEGRGISLDQLPALFKSLISSSNRRKGQISCVWEASVYQINSSHFHLVQRRTVAVL